MKRPKCFLIVDSETPVWSESHERFTGSAADRQTEMYVSFVE